MRRVGLVTVLFFLAACDCSDEPNPEISNSYLPLSIGNFWDFKSTSHSGDELIEHREVEDIVTLNDREYFMLVSTRLSEIWSGHYRDTAYYRIDNDGFVFVYRKNIGIEENRYRLNAKDGDTWSYPFVDDYVADIRLSERSKTVGKTEVDHCKDYSFDVQQWADEEYTYTLAPGVGFLKEFSDSWGAGQELKRAKVNGRLFEF